MILYKNDIAYIFLQSIMILNEKYLVRKLRSIFMPEYYINFMFIKRMNWQNKYLQYKYIFYITNTWIDVQIILFFI